MGFMLATESIMYHDECGLEAAHATVGPCLDQCLDESACLCAIAGSKCQVMLCVETKVVVSK